jgi:hypothetical protein
MKRTTNILTKAGVLLIATMMVLSILPAVTADASDYKDARKTINMCLENPDPTAPRIAPGTILGRLPLEESSSFDAAPGDVLFLQPVDLPGSSWSFANIKESDGYGMYENFQLSANEPIGQVEIIGLSLAYSGGWVEVDPALAEFTIEFYDDPYTEQLPPDEPIAGASFNVGPGLPYVMEGNPGDYNGFTAYKWTIDLSSDVTVTGQDGVMYVGESGPAGVGGCLWGSSQVGDLWSYQVGGSPPDTVYDRAMTLYAGGGGGPTPGEDCIPDVCDFAIDGFTEEFLAMSNEIDVNGDGSTDYYVWNSFPKEICIRIANKGEIGIGELKLMADVFKKVCGDTVIIIDDPKYNLQEFPCCGADYPIEFPEPGMWKVEDDGDQDSWCLQGGEENRWLTNNQAWRCTKGEDRSFGVDADVYLGKSDLSPPNVFDNLTTPWFDVRGLACAEISFSHWCEGEYIIDEDGFIIPADYGVLYYSIDNGTTWKMVPQTDFLAYDTNGEWEEVTLKFINTAIDEDDLDYMHPFNMVCDDCEPDEDDIIVEDNLNDAVLRLKFSWKKDPCLQYEGWYVDAFKVIGVEDYELELTCQTHEILELEPCDAEKGVQWGYLDEDGDGELDDYCFPLPCTFEDDTWYEIHVLGQVFSPYGCEDDLENNEFKFQFKIQDIHDMACIDMEALTDTVTEPGDSIAVNVTVQNKGTFAEDKVPVSLQVGDLINIPLVDDDFETDSLGDYSIYYFLYGPGTLTPWRWSSGDPSIDMIYDNDPCQARSRNPGDECILCAEEGNMPYLPEDVMTLLVCDETIDADLNNNGVTDCDDIVEATTSFDVKYSMELEEYFYYYSGAVPQSLGSYASFCVLPQEGEAADYVFFVEIGIGNDPDGYSNDWVHVELDLIDIIEDIAFNSGFDYDYLPACQFGFFVVSQGPNVDKSSQGGRFEDPDGGCANALNPVPWTGLMIDRWDMNVIDVDDSTLKEVAVAETGALKPGDTETLQMSWQSEKCAHVLTAETQLSTDINPSNDRCCNVQTFTAEEERCFESFIEDMTGGGDCLWHACTNREGGDDYFAWAGVETEQSARYVNNMDDALISPTIKFVSVDPDDPYNFKDEGVLLNFSTWYEFENGDFGEVDIFRTFDHDNDPDTEDVTRWDNLKRIKGSSLGAFEKVCIYIPEEDVPEHPTKIRFRMYSNEEDVNEGWYIDDVIFYNVTDDGDPGTLASAYLAYTDGYTENAYAWTSGAAWCEAALFDDELDPYRTYEITELRISGGCDDYGFYANDYEIYIEPGTFDISAATPVTTGTSSATGWTTVPIPNYPIPDTGDVLVAVNWLAGYDGYPAGFDYVGSFIPDENGGLMLYLDTTNDWSTTLFDLWGSPAVWGIEVGLEEGGAGLEDLVIGDCIELFPWDAYKFPGQEGPAGCSETWERGEIAPWSCEPVDGGQFWLKWTNFFDNSSLPNDENDIDFDPCIDCGYAWYTIPSENLVPYGYNAEGGPMNNAIAFELDLTEGLDPNYIVFDCAMNYEFKKERAYIEFSPDWDPETPMESATWVVYWCHTPGDEYGDDTEGWKTLDEILDDAGHPDDRFNIDEYAGEKVYVRFRLETDGNGAAIGDGWAIDGIKLRVKRSDITFEDNEPPVTSIFFNAGTAKVTLVAQDYPLNKGSGVDATFYKIDGGEEQTYGGPFTLDEGTHTVEYYSIDNANNKEATKSAQFTVDTEEPSVQITSPLAGKLYLFGSPIMDRILSDSTLCIGKVPIAADADDGDGVGVARVLFNINGDSGYDDSAPYEYEFRKMHFGDLTISAVAVDGNGLLSSPDSITVKVYSLGLL